MKKECIAMLLAGGQGSRLYVLTENMAKARRPVRREVPHHRLSPFQLRELRHRHRRRAHAVPARWSSTATSATASPGTWTARTAAYTSSRPTMKREGRRRGTRARPTPSTRTSASSTCTTPTMCSSSPATTSTRWTTPQCSRTTSECSADCTIAVMEVPWDEASRFGIMNVDGEDTITEFEEKPKQPKSNLASMGIYVFSWKKLRAVPHRRTRTTPASSNDFGKNIIPAMLNAGEKMVRLPLRGLLEGRRHARFPLGREHGYARAGQRAEPARQRTGPSTPVRQSEPPAYLGETAEVDHSVVTRRLGGRGRGTTIPCSRSAVTVAEGAEVEYSILMPGAVVERGARVAYAILGENVRVGENARVGASPEAAPPEAVGHHGRRPRGTDRGGPHAQGKPDAQPRRKGDGTMNGLHGIIFCLRTGAGTARAGGTPRCPPPSRSADATASSISCSPICIAAGITDVGVVLHGNYQSLLDHIGNGKDLGHGAQVRRAAYPAALRRYPRTTAAASSAARWRPLPASAHIYRGYGRTTSCSPTATLSSICRSRTCLPRIWRAARTSPAVCTANGGFVDNATYLTLERDGAIGQVSVRADRAARPPLAGDLHSQQAAAAHARGRVLRAG